MPDFPSRGQEPERRARASLGSLAGLLAVLAPAFAACAAFAACTQGAATSVYTPPTGITLLSADVAAGHGCGFGPDQVYKYAALVTYAQAGADAPVLASNVFDCYSDGVFTNLPLDDAGDQAYAVAVYAFNACSFSGLTDPPCPLTVTGGCPGEDAAALQSALPAAEWSTTCTATQAQNLTVVAYCPPLVATGSAGGCLDASAMGADGGTE